MAEEVNREWNKGNKDDDIIRAGWCHYPTVMMTSSRGYSDTILIG